AAEHIGGADDDRGADPFHDLARRLHRACRPVLRLPELQLVDQFLETLAVLGEVDHVGRGAEDRYVRRLQSGRELQRRLSAELHDDAKQTAPPLFATDDILYVL